MTKSYIKGKIKLTKTQLNMIEALRAQLGNITAACAEVGIVRQTHYRWLEESKKYTEEYEQIQEEVLDFAENSLHRQIAAHNTTATIFFLKSKGKRRGFVERQEVNVSGGVTDFVRAFSDAYEETTSI